MMHFDTVLYGGKNNRYVWYHTTFQYLPSIPVDRFQLEQAKNKNKSVEIRVNYNRCSTNMGPICLSDFIIGGR